VEPMMPRGTQAQPPRRGVAHHSAPQVVCGSHEQPDSTGPPHSVG